EDIDLAKRMGCRLFRFSLSWSRLEPKPEQFDPRALDHYEAVLEAVRQADMVPMVTLHHFVWPLHVEQQGGLLSAGFPSRLARYAGFVAERFRSRVGFWITINEPTLLPFGFIKPWLRSDYASPPGTAGVSSAGQIDAVATLM